MIGQKLGSFRIESKIGSGAMGVVYRAVHEPTGRQAAVKVITGEASQRGNAAERFEREAEILQKLKHPNIVRFLGVGRYQGTSYFAMEYVEGDTLEQVLEATEDGSLPWREVVELGIQICDALHYAHGFRVVHRDLKPANLMLTGAGQVKLADFGIAKDQDATALTATGRTLGTAAYMAPEQISGSPEVSHKTDLYALGCVLYQMLTGRPPFRGNTPMALMHSHLKDAPPRPSEKILEIPRALDDLVVQLMAKKPEDRPWDAEQAGLTLAEIRDKAARGEPIPMVWPDATSGTVDAWTMASRDLNRPGAPRKKRRKKRRTSHGPPWLEPALLGLALVALIAFIAYMAMPPSAEYLHRRAAAVMDSGDLSDWKIADKDYISELARRYPKAYAGDVTRWRDQIALEDARRKAFNLGRGLRLRPHDQAEASYQETYALAAEQVKDGRDNEAAKTWRELAESLNGTPEARGWTLLAQERADELDRTLAQRRKLVEGRLDAADKADFDGRGGEATKIRREVIARYARHPELADQIQRARAALPPDSPPPAEPAAGDEKATP